MTKRVAPQSAANITSVVRGRAMGTAHSEDGEIDRRTGQRVRTLRLRRGLGLRACAEIQQAN